MRAVLSAYLMPKSSAQHKRPAARDAGVQSVDVALQLLSMLAHERRPVKLTELATRAAMAPAKVHRYLTSLVRNGYAAQDPDTGLYGTGSQAMDFSLSCLSTIEPINVASKEAVALSRLTGNTAAISVWGSFGPTVVRWEQPARPIMVNVGPGSVFPLHESATGRVFLAFYDTAVIAAHQRRAGVSPPSEPTNRSSARGPYETVEQVRARGMARARGDFMTGMSAFSAPVFDHRERMVLAITLLDYSIAWDHRWQGEHARALRAAASRVSGQLGYRGGAGAPGG